MESKTLYEKRGRKYYPVSEMESFDGLTEGHYLVSVKPGCRSTRTILDPDYANVEAVLSEMEDVMVTELLKASSLQHQRCITPREHKAFLIWKQLAGPNAILSLNQNSACEIIRTGLNVLKEKIKKKKVTT